MVVITGGGTGKYINVFNLNATWYSVLTRFAAGIGQMMTRAFATNGAAKVYIVGRRKEKLDETAALNPEVIVPIVGDVTSKESLCQVADQVEKDAGYVNLVCVNSGTMPPAIGVNSREVDVHTYRQKALEQRTEDWEETFKTNSIAVFFTTMAFLTLLDAGNKRQNFPLQQSQVLVTSSIAGYLRVPMNMGVYPASKASATHLVKHLAGTLVPYSIRVNAIAPGLFPSDLAAGLIARANTDGRDATGYGAFGKDFIPAERLGRTEDMAGTVLYMASAAGAYLNGNITVLDGGEFSIHPLFFFFFSFFTECLDWTPEADFNSQDVLASCLARTKYFSSNEHNAFNFKTQKKKKNLLLPIDIDFTASTVVVRILRFSTIR